MAPWKFHHIGVAVPALEPAIALNEQVFGLRLVSGPFHDPQQRVSVCFLAGADPTAPVIELVAPAGDSSPIASYLTRGLGAYHTCYEVDDLDQALARVRAQRCVIVSGPTPAVAFGGRHIAWFFAPTRQLTELLQAAPAGSSAAPGAAEAATDHAAV